MRSFKSTAPARLARTKSCHIQLMFTILERIKKNFIISISDVYVFQFSNGVDGFSKLFHFYLQKIQ